MQSAAEHCALMRIYEEKDAWKGIFHGYGPNMGRVLVIVTESISESLILWNGVLLNPWSFTWIILLDP